MNTQNKKNYQLFSTSSFSAKEYSNVHCHMHANLEMEIVIVHDGELNITIEKSKYNVKKGECIFILPFEQHNFNSINDNVSHVIMFHDPYYNFFFQMVGNYQPKTRIFSIETNLESYISQLLADKNSHEVLLQHSIVFPLFHEIKEKCEFYEEKIYSDLFLDALTYINKNLSSALLSEQQIADALFIHPVSLSRIFSKCTGMNIKKYINQRRVIYSYELLQQGRSITDAAYEAGFGSIRNFNRAFYDYFQQTPTEILKNKG